MTTDLPGLPKLYTEQELADYLEIELHTVRRLRRCGKLRYTRAGVSPRFTEAHVREYLEIGRTLMPKQKKRLYQHGPFWLEAPDTKYRDYGICWYDAAARQTRRLGTQCTDFDEAKTALDKHALEKGDGSHKDELVLQTVQRYYLRYAQSLPSESNVKDTIKFVGLYCRDNAGDPVSVSKFDADQQRKLVTKLRQHGLSDNTISSHFVYIFAALCYAIQFNHLTEKVVPKRLAKRFWGERTEPRKRANARGKRALSVQEWGALFDAADELGEHSVRYLICALATIGRPAAVIQLTGQQIDLNLGIVDLNQPGRPQTKKRRPKVPICSTFRQWLQTWSVPPEQRCITRRSRAMVTRGFIWSIIHKAKIPDCNPYTLRHSVASWLAWKGVSKWERKKAMGHAKVDGGSTDTYTHYDPRFLHSVSEALDALFQGIAPYTRVNLLHRVTEDQGMPETLWHSVPESFRLPPYQTRLIAPEISEIPAALTSPEPGSLEIQTAPDRHQQNQQKSFVSQKPLVRGRRPRSPTLAADSLCLSMRFPTLRPDLSAGAWQVRGRDLTQALLNQAFSSKKAHVNWVRLEDRGDVQIFMKVNDLRSLTTQLSRRFSMQNCTIEYKQKQ